MTHGPAPIAAFEPAGGDLAGGVVTLAFGVVLGTVVLTSDDGDVLIGLCGFITLAGAAMTAWIGRRRVEIFADRVVDRTLLRTRTILWDELAKVTVTEVRHRMYYVIPVRKSLMLVLEDESGAKANVGHLVQDRDKLERLVIGAARHHLGPKLWDRFQSGETLEFGKVRLSRHEGLRFRMFLRNRVVPVNDILVVVEDQGGLLLLGPGKALGTITLAGIPNAVFLAEILLRVAVENSA